MRTPPLATGTPHDEGHGKDQQLSDSPGVGAPQDRPIFVVRLRPGPNGLLGLRALLKRAKRDHGLICVGLAIDVEPRA
jgi:hypothetical protein